MKPCATEFLVPTVGGLVERRVESVVKGWLAAFLALGLVSGAAAQSRPEILIGASLPLSGFNAGAGQEGLAVAKAYIDSVNQAGGIGGQKLSLMALDDEFNPQKAAANARKLVESNAVAIFNCWGTASCSAMMPVITDAGIPMVAGIAGGGPMRMSPGRYAFNVRPTTRDEIAGMVNQMQVVGQNQIALVYQNDPFGKSGQTAAQAVFSEKGLQPLAELPLEVDGSNVPAVVEALRKFPKLNGIILIAAPPPTVKLIQQSRQSGLLGVQFYNLAAQANAKLVADLGKDTAGVVFTTLVPHPWRERVPVVKEYKTIYAAATGKQEFSYLGLEVFINMKVLVEGLRKAAPGVSRDSLIRAMESMTELRYGPMTIKYGPADREGSRYVGLTMIDRSGRFLD